MVTIFTRYKTNGPTKKAIDWLEKYKISYQVIYPKDISEKYVKHLLKLSNGINDILASECRKKKCEKLEFKQYCLEDMSVNELICMLTKNPVLLKSLILFDEKRMLAGYSEEEIRIFLPASYRQIRCRKKKYTL
ncbi:ArsC/Spx/MgsR family protein [Lactococcus garvieae]|uniref:ArsC/Spx/MgsR family protein n=1 Tax=Lactococcus garvieae TaxID=1363 RepID=UPI003D77BBDE